MERVVAGGRWDLTRIGNATHGLGPGLGAAVAFVRSGWSRHAGVAGFWHHRAGDVHVEHGGGQSPVAHRDHGRHEVVCRSDINRADCRVHRLGGLHVHGSAHQHTAQCHGLCARRTDHQGSRGARTGGGDGGWLADHLWQWLPVTLVGSDVIVRCAFCICRRDDRPEPVACSGMARTQFRIVFVTTPDLKTARRLARLALEKRLIACANLVPRIESHYRWQGRLEQGDEVLMVMKTTVARVGALEKLIVAQHPYETPEFVVMNLGGGAKKYLTWLVECCA